MIQAIRNFFYEYIFIKHNKKIFKAEKNKKSSKIVLLEFNGWNGIHIIYSYLSDYFIKKGCKIIAFENYKIFNEKEKVYNQIIKKIGISLKLRSFGIFKSFGVDNFLFPTFDENIKKKSLFYQKKFFEKKRTLTELENIKIEGIWLGDLIYDSYLKKYNVGSIDLEHPDFKLFFYNFLNIFFYWKEYFKKNNVYGVCVSHAVYVYAIPLRIAAKQKKISLCWDELNVVNLKNIISYKKKRGGSYSRFLFYNKEFSKIKDKKKALDEGKKILKEIVEGKSKYHYLKNKTFNKRKKEIKFKIKKNKIKVLIFAHNISDSPHVYGNHLFTDFNEWLIFLSKIIKKTDYQWFIKSHPEKHKLTDDMVDKFAKENNINILPSNFPNNYLKKIDINFVLTVFGTVASELPIFNINVINASKNNPHFNYRFCINPKNLKEYRHTLLNLKNNKFKANLNDLYKFHYIKNYLNKNNFIFKDHLKFFKFKDNKQNFYKPLAYKIWIDNFNLLNHKRIINKYNNLIKTDKYYL